MAGWTTLRNLYIAELQQRREEGVRLDEFLARHPDVPNDQAELNALPTCDFTGMEMRTKAFGRVKILRQEENRLKFEVNGVEKTFALPACIAQGFLIPDDPAVIAAFQRRQELEEKLKSLQKNGLPK